MQQTISQNQMAAAGQNSDRVQLFNGNVIEKSSRGFCVGIRTAPGQYDGWEAFPTMEEAKAAGGEPTQLDRHYYYRPIAAFGGARLKCAGHGAENPEHLKFYRPHFRTNADKENSGCPFMAGVVILVGYHGDQVTRDYAIANALHNDLPL